MSLWASTSMRHAMSRRLAAMFLFSASIALAQQTAPPANDVKIANDIAYKSGESLTDYEKERCKLDVYAPAIAPAGGAPVLVWFYGGGLEQGKKENGIPFGKAWAKQGLVVVIPNYRLSPAAKFPAYLDDAAASVSWAFKHAAEFGGNPKKVFITGHSAGGYLSAQIAFDPKYLAAYGLKPSDLSGTLPISGQMFTHFTIRKERGVPNPGVTPVIDSEAPAYHVKKDLPPTLLIIGDRDWPVRLEETQYLYAMAKHLKAPDIELKVVADRDHGSIMNNMVNPIDPGWVAMLEFIRKH